jgi:tRNA A-37 threonylcarbamoyl transferase component Bud32
VTGSAEVDPALLEALKRQGLDTLEGAFAFREGLDLFKGGLGQRRRTYLEVTDQSGRRHRLYLKRYGRERLAARLRRCFTYGCGLSAAEVEWRNIQAARAIGLPTMQAVIRAQEGECVGGGRSYIIVTAVAGDAMSRCGEDFILRRGEQAAADLTDRLAGMVATLHGSGYAHRDLYAAHIFLDDRDGRPQLCLIDLARMFAPRWRAFRWRVKDLAQLKCSMPGAWTDRHWDDFLAAYLARCGGGNRRRYNRAVDRKAASVIRRHFRRQVRIRSDESPSS